MEPIPVLASSTERYEWRKIFSYLIVRQSRSVKMLSIQRPPSVHTDFDVVLKDEGREITTGELHALIRIPDIRCCNFECVRECFNAEICFKRRRHLPGDHISTEPVEDGHEIGEAAFQFHVRDIRSPDLIWTDNVEALSGYGYFWCNGSPWLQSLLFLGYTASIPISSMRRRTWSRQMDVSWLWASSTRIRREP